MKRAARALLGLAGAWLLLSGGAWLAWGPGYGLMAAGVTLAAYLLVIYDVDEPPQEEPPPVAVVDVHPLRTLRDMEAALDRGESL